jgi:hypothetical protein
MTVTELGALGEFLGFFAVLATLVYLALQTRLTSQIAAGQAARAMSNDFQTLWTALAENDDLMQLMRRGMNQWESLNNQEQSRVHTIFMNIALHLQGCISSAVTGETRETIAGWEDNFLGLIRCSGGAQWWDSIRYLFDNEFGRRIQARLDDPSSLPPPWTDQISWWNIDENDR